MTDRIARYEDDPDRTSVTHAAAWVLSHRRIGAYCPCCTQLAKVYRRKLNSSMACVLILMHRRDMLRYDEWFHVPSYLNEVGLKPGMAAAVRGDWAKLSHWGLIEAKPGPNEGQGRTSGFWKITDRGRAFAAGEIEVESHVYLFDEQCLKLDDKKMINIRYALGNKFNYIELMNS